MERVTALCIALVLRSVCSQFLPELCPPMCSFNYEMGVCLCKSDFNEAKLASCFHPCRPINGECFCNVPASLPVWLGPHPKELHLRKRPDVDRMFLKESSEASLYYPSPSIEEIPSEYYRRFVHVDTELTCDPPCWPVDESCECPPQDISLCPAWCAVLDGKCSCNYTIPTRKSTHHIRVRLTQNQNDYPVFRP